ncbi:hypothetical protein QJQ45_004205 [Haematococcus lacustris]|nr:hypothetical protein QJQ45_004205 [Haematococcus lacustris]
MEDGSGATVLPVGLALGVASAIALSVSLAFLIYRRTDTSARQGAAVARKLSSAIRQASLENPNKPRVRILYGTQTGTAERFSKQLAGELRNKYGESTIVDVLDLENYKPAEQLHREKLVVLCVATYGDGEPTDNAADFYSWLIKEAEAPHNSLQGVHFAVFGLGNKQYEHFNAVGKKVFSSLEAMGATAVVGRGDGDDDACIDDDYDKWCADLLAVLDKRGDLVGCLADTNGHNSPAALPAYDVAIQDAGSVAEVAAWPAAGSGKDHHSPFWAPLSCVKELHGAASDRSCVHVELDISGAEASYQHGDHVAVYAQNSPAVVETAAKLLGYPPDTLITLTVPEGEAGLAAPFPGPLTLRSALAFFTDLLASPHKDALQALASCASAPEEAARLVLLASSSGKAEYADWVARPHRSLLEVMQAFPSARPPLGLFFASIAPRLQPRYYSISSSPLAHPRCVHVTCAVVREKMGSGRLHEGVASSWFKRQQGQAGEVRAPIFLRSSHFKLPADPSVPIIMVGPGTGLAPFRGFLQERTALVAAGKALGPAVLFFGCRSREQDYLYQEELAAALASGALSALHVAFSRQGPAKDYVQHHMEREASQIWQLLEAQQGCLYVCGDAKHMAKDVHRTLVGLVQREGGRSGTEAEAWVKALQDAGRYQRDVW